jgi:hypothetical protein
MAYTAPTAAQVKARFQCFAAVDDTLIELLIAEAPVDDSWREKDYLFAIMYWVAHKLTIENAISGKPADTAGPVTSRSIDDASESYGQAVAPANAIGDYASTPYGREFMRLLRGNHGGPLTT